MLSAISSQRSAKKLNYEPLAKVVTPAKAGVQIGCNATQLLDSGFRRNDGKGTK
jgi:hypothetical protein